MERAVPEQHHTPPELAELARDFEILGEIGRGATAVVYRARERELDRLVAIKVIRARHLADDEAVRRLEREARLVARFNHPNVVSLHAVRRLRHDSLALIMRYVHGETLRAELRRRGPLPAARVRRLAADVARALAAAHAYGVVHRDVKPENVYIEHPSGRALLADFGAAAPLESNVRLTAAGVTIGTPGYLAPELVDGADATPSSDLYALGLVAWEALTGVQPWAGETLFEVLAFRKHGTLPPLSSLVADVPPGLEVAVERALRAEPAERWLDANAMLAALVAPDPPRRGGFRSRLSGWRDAAPAAAAPPVTVNGHLPGPAAPVAPAADGDLPTVAIGQRPALQPPPFSPTSVRAAPPAAGASAAGASAPPRETAAGADGRDAPTSAPAGPVPPGSTGRARPATGAVADDDRGDELEEWGPDELRRPWRRLGVVAAVGAVLAAVLAFVLLQDGVPERVGGFAVFEPGSDAGRAVEVEIERGGSVALPDSPAPAPVSPAAPERAADSASPAGAVDASIDSALRGAPTPPAEPPVPAERLFGDVTASSRVVRPAPAPATAAQLPAPPAAAGAELAPQPAPDAGAAARAAAPPQPASPEPVERPSDTPAPASRAPGATAPTVAPAPPAAPSPNAAAPGRPAAFVSREVATGGMHSCSISSGGTLFCWGGNDRGQLGADGGRSLTASPVALPGRVSSVALGLLHSCVIQAGGTVVCWGANERGQLGDGSRAPRSASAGVPGLGDAVEVAVGSAHSCALQRGGRALCWGANDQGQLGIGHRVDREAPSFVAGGLRLASLVAGWNHTCALQADGTAFCWGSGGDGQLGDGGTVSRPHPVRVSGANRFRSLAAGRAHTCGATTSGTVLCWGDNRSGQAGDPDSRRIQTPRAVDDVAGAVKVVAGSLHTCALTGQGETICWGQNRYGQLGDGTTSDRARPAPVSGAPPFVDIAASAAHTCGVTRDGEVYCWGYNLEGQLGDGTRANRERPVRVRAGGR